VKLESFPYGSAGSPEYKQIEQTRDTTIDKMAKVFEAIKQDNRLTQQQKEQMNSEGRNAKNSVDAQYESGQLQQTPGLQISGGAGTAPVPYKNESGQYPGMSAIPQMNQQMPQQGGVYNPGIAPGATIYTPGVVNVAQPQMTDEQKAFADFRGNLKGQVYQANQVAYQNSQRPRQYPIYQTYQQPVYQGTNTQDKYNVFYEIAEGVIGNLITESVSEHTHLEEIISLDSNLSQITSDIETKNKAIEKQNEIISECNEQIETLEQYLRDNFELCDVCGSVK
jgi:hypothetical protein